MNRFAKMKKERIYTLLGTLSFVFYRTFEVLEAGLSGNKKKPQIIDL